VDKLKVALALAKKYYFWVVCGGLTALGLVIWLGATANLRKRFEDSKTRIDGVFSAMKSIVDRPNHPNPSVITAAEGSTNALKTQVLDAWQMLYDKQEKMNPLPPILQEDFIDAYKKCGDKDELAVKFRDRYWNFIRYHLPTLCKSHGVIEEKDTMTPGRRGAYGTSSGEGMAPGVGDPAAAAAEQENVKTEGVVYWDADDRGLFMQNFVWERTPTTLQVKLAQQDLWVYEALLRIIAKTNEGCEDNRDANIKTIVALEIAQRAVASRQKEQDSVVKAGTDAKSAGGAGGAAGAGAPGASGEGGSGAAAKKKAAGDEADLMADRYVDQEDKPLAAGAKEPFAEFKIMPIRMKLVIKQTFIPKLIAACANSEMPIEVRRVRLHPDAGTGALDLTAATAAAAAGGAEGAMMGPSAPVRRPMAGMGEGSTSTTQGPATTEDAAIPVELTGFIYIYNPPDIAKLGTGTAGKEPEAPAEGEAAPEGEKTGEGEEAGEKPPTDAGAPPATPEGAPTTTPAGAPTPPQGPPATPPAGVPGAPPAGVPGAPPAAPAAAPPGGPAAPPNPAAAPPAGKS
jgi:hypothetical protein